MQSRAESNQSRSGKKDEVSSILARLESDNLEQKTSQQRLTNLSRLKVLGREPRDAEQISSEKGLQILARHGLDGEPDECALEALRCIANALLLVPESRQRYSDLGFAEKTSEKLFNTEGDDCEFLLSRILFLLTYDTNLDFEKLVLKYHLKDAILKNIERHASTSETGTSRSQMATMAISETLKLMFNVTHHFPKLSAGFNPAISPLLKILRYQNPLPQPPLEAPVGHLVNVLLNLDLPNQIEAVFPSSQPERNIKKLIEILEATVFAYPSTTIDNQAAPLVNVIAGLYKSAPDLAKSFMKSALLPSADERNQPLGRSETLPGKLLRLSTTARTPELRDTILGLMFDLSDKDAGIFVKNVGYGYASGFLVNHDISTAGLFPQREAAQSSSRSGQSGSAGKDGDVNFVTGQYLDREPAEQGPEMSEEEKMREAERLFVLFERLKKTGVVTVQNPVETAARSGQLEELDE